MNDTQGFGFDVFSSWKVLPIRQIAPAAGGPRGVRGGARPSAINIYVRYEDRTPVSISKIRSIDVTGVGAVPITAPQPFIAQNVLPGLVTITVRVRDFEPQERELQVRGNQTFNVPFTFTRKESERAEIVERKKRTRFKNAFQGELIKRRADLDKMGPETRKEFEKKLADEIYDKIYTKEEKELITKQREEGKKKHEEEKELIKKGKKEKFEKSPYNFLFRGKVSAHVMKVLGIVALIGIGALVSGMFGSYWFMIAFMGWAAMTMVPNPEEEEDFHISDNEKKLLASVGKNDPSAVATTAVMLWTLGKKTLKHPRVGFGFVRAIFKLTAISFAIYGIYSSDVIPFKAIVLLIACFAAYYSLKITYKRNMPHHFLESVLRFGFLGCWMIPYIFFEYFQSSVLGLIAIAFLAIPPIQESEKPSEVETSSFLDIFLRFVVFGGLMLIVLAGSGVFPWMSNIFGAFNLTWGLTGMLKNTFIYFWVISLIAGLFASNETRPAMGFIMLLASTVIFGLGPGQQEVGTALFGQWYPTIQNFMSAVGKPFGDLFGTLGSTFGSTWMLLTNPIGYAQQIQNGTYVKDPATGIAGAFGIELDNIQATAIYNDQPYLLMMSVKNKGAYDAKNVKVMIQPNARWKIGVPAPTTESTTYGSYWTSVIPVVGAVQTGRTLVNRAFYEKKESVKMLEFGFETKPDSNQYCAGAASSDVKTAAIVEGIEACGYPVGDMQKLDVQQAAFSSKGINCSTIVNYKLMTKDKAKVLPFNIQLNYDYEIDSTFDIQFMSSNEWQRLAQLEQLAQPRKAASTFKNAPVRLNIDTLEQPIREGVTYHIAFNLLSAQPDSDISNVKTVVRYPEAMGEASCMAEGGAIKPSLSADGKSYEIKKDWDKGPYVMFCTFSGGYKGGKDKKSMSKPTESFTITAHADYTFSKYQSYDTRIQFGGEPCCDDPQNTGSGPFPCPLGISAQKCGTEGKDKNKCVTGGSGTSDISAKISQLEQQMSQIESQFADKLVEKIDAYNALLVEVTKLEQQYKDDQAVLSKINSLKAAINKAISDAKSICQQRGITCP